MRCYYSYLQFAGKKIGSGKENRLFLSLFINIKSDIDQIDWSDKCWKQAKICVLHSAHKVRVHLRFTGALGSPMMLNINMIVSLLRGRLVAFILDDMPKSVEPQLNHISKSQS